MQLALAAGIRMRAIPGERHNIKVAKAEDCRIAQHLATCSHERTPIGIVSLT